ncbi:MAG: ATP F0F1 synthase subunit B [Prochloraceae cyanobacterium]|nr:ATP F0F1 synthase subunit B [Prochloraceae cyanobacterium]
MLVSVFTVIAEIVNFLILVALLKRFLYKPIITAMEKREREIERRLEEAAIARQDARDKAELYRQKQQELEAQKVAWLTEAKQEIDLEKEQFKKQAEAEVNQSRSQWYLSLEREQAKFLQDLRQKIGQQITATTRKVLADLANSDLEAAIVSNFIHRLNNLTDTDLKSIQSALQANLKPTVNIKSGFTIAPDRKEQLINILRERIGADLKVSFEVVNSNSLCGIELNSGGYRIAWNLENYIAQLEAATVKAFSANNREIAKVDQSKNQ